MYNRLLPFVAAAVLLVPNLYSHQPVKSASIGVTVTAEAVSATECKELFGKDLRVHRIYPIRFTLHNVQNVPVCVSLKDIQVTGAKLLTKQSIQASIAAIQATSLICCITVVLIPFGVLAQNSIPHLTELLTLVERFTLGDQTVTIQPGNEYETFVFPEYDAPKTEYPRDEQGNRLLDEKGKELPGKTAAFVAPSSIEVGISLVSSTRRCTPSFVFNIPVLN